MLFHKKVKEKPSALTFHTKFGKKNMFLQKENLCHLFQIKYGPGESWIFPLTSFWGGEGIW